MLTASSVTTKPFSETKAVQAESHRDHPASQFPVRTNLTEAIMATMTKIHHIPGSNLLPRSNGSYSSSLVSTLPLVSPILSADSRHSSRRSGPSCTALSASRKGEDSCTVDIDERTSLSRRVEGSATDQSSASHALENFDAVWQEKLRGERGWSTEQEELAERLAIRALGGISRNARARRLEGHGSECSVAPSDEEEHVFPSSRISGHSCSTLAKSTSDGSIENHQLQGQGWQRQAREMKRKIKKVAKKMKENHFRTRTLPFSQKDASSLPGTEELQQIGDAKRESLGDVRSRNDGTHIPLPSDQARREPIVQKEGNAVHDVVAAVRSSPSTPEPTSKSWRRWGRGRVGPKIKWP